MQMQQQQQQMQQQQGDGGGKNPLKLRLDLNLEIEIELKAHIHGDLTLALLYVNYLLTPIFHPLLQPFFLLSTVAVTRPLLLASASMHAESSNSSPHPLPLFPSNHNKFLNGGLYSSQ
jgi:hypothetical protein